MIAHLPLALFLFGWGALGWWSASHVQTLYGPLKLGLSYRVYQLLPLLWGRYVKQREGAP